MRYFLSLSYDGTDFCGWQIQPSSPSVQACLEEALSRLLGGPVPVTGAGRTDTGVHAFGYVAHFDWPQGSLPFEAPDFIYKLNAILPHSVAVFSVTPVPDDLHARFSAVRREYTYFIHRRKDPFVRNYSWLCGYPSLDFAAMNEACRYLLGTHDFSCFEKTGGDNKTSVCTVSEAFWKPYTPTHVQLMSEGGNAVPGACPPPEGLRGRCPRMTPAAFSPSKILPDGKIPGTAGRRMAPITHALGGAGAERSEAESPVGVLPSDYWYFRISADRFLRNMVRATVGSLIEVGRGKHRPEWIAELIASGTRSDAGESVPGHALFLNRVDYPWR